MASYRELAGALEALVRSIRVREVSPSSVLLQQCERLVAEAKAGRNIESPWTAFESAAPIIDTHPEMLRRIAAVTGGTAEDAKAFLEAEAANNALFVNSRYQVAVRRMEHFIYLSIKRLDQQPIRSWRDLQRIKNELLGPECEAIELFPAEDRLLDSANQYHLFARRGAARFAFGTNERIVSGEQGVGEGQEPFD